MDAIIAFLSSILHTDLTVWAATIVALATAILMPWPVDKWPKVRRIVEFLAGNWFHAKDATTDGK